MGLKHNFVNLLNGAASAPYRDTASLAARFSDSRCMNLDLPSS